MALAPAATDALEEIFICDSRGEENPRSSQMKISSSRFRGSWRSCHQCSGTSIQTNSFGPSLQGLSNVFPSKNLGTFLIVLDLLSYTLQLSTVLHQNVQP